VIVGVVGGVFSGTFGGGGGVIIVPLLVTLAGFDQRRAAATSLLAIMPSSLAGAITYFVHGQVDLVAAAAISLGAIAGSLVGSALLKRLPLVWLRWGFIALLVVVAVRLLLLEPSRGHQLELSPALVVAYLVLGIVMGVCSGLFGIGGAIISVPILITVLGSSDLVAKGTSLLALVATSATGSLASRRNGLVDVRSGLIVGGVAAVFSVAGAFIGLAIPARLSTILFAGLILVVAIQLAVRYSRPSTR
jgi:uncharacterized protein